MIITGKHIDIPIPVNEITVRKENILSLLGYSISDHDEHVDSVIEQCLLKSSDEIKPKAGVRFVKAGEVRISEGKIFIEKEVFQVDKIIAAQLRKAEYLALFVCSIGKDLETQSKQYMEAGDLLEGYICDLMGSEAAEEVAEIVHQEIRSIAQKNGLDVSNRYSPGYCNWDVKEQFKLFGFFPENYAGIHLTSSALMDPVKSVSGIIGVGREMKLKPYTCSACSDDKCIFRNKKTR